MLGNSVYAEERQRQRQRGDRHTEILDKNIERKRDRDKYRERQRGTEREREREINRESYINRDNRPIRDCLNCQQHSYLPC